MMKKILFLILLLVGFSLVSCVYPQETPSPEETLLDFENIEFSDESVTYDGKEHTIIVSGAPDFAEVTYTNDGPYVNVGEYEITATISANGYNDLVLTATLTITPSEVGLTFEEYNRYIVNKPYSDLPHTIEMDIKLDENVSGEAGSLFSNFDWGVYGGAGTGHGRLFHTAISNGILILEYTNEYYVRETITFDGVDLRTGDWVNVALTIDVYNKTANLYVDGEFKLSKSINAELSNLITKTFYHIGGDNRTLNPFWFKGEIREVAVFSDVRSASEIENDYLEGIDLNDKDLMAQYYLAGIDQHQNIVDNSGNNYWLRYEDTWYDEQEIEMDYAYSFAVVGDTQMLNYWAPGANGEQHDATKISNNMNGLYKWILDNQESQKIQHVFGLGDITETWAKNDTQAAAEWGRAKEAIYQMNGKISYSLVRGNHDESKYMNQYFNEEVYKSQFNGFYNDTINTFYKTLKIGSVDFLFIGLDYGASDDELAWAGSIVEAHPNHKVIVTTHGYLEQEGHRSGSDDPDHPCDASDVDSDANYNNGEGIWEKFISKYENIFLVMSGHKFDEDVVCTQSYGVHGNVVTEMLIDFQDVDKQLVSSKGENPAGIVTMLYMNEDCTEIEVVAYSTVRNQYYKKNNHYTIKVNGVCEGNHDLIYHAANTETCTTNGNCEYYSCSTCGTNFDKDGNVLYDVNIDAIGHNYEETLKNESEITYTCSNCGESYIERLDCTILVNHLYLDGTEASLQEVLKVHKGSQYTIYANNISGYVASHDYIKVHVLDDTNVINIYYSQVDVWNGVTVSTSLQGSGTQADPYLIQSGADLAYIANVTNTENAAKRNSFAGKYFKLTKSIDLNNHELHIGTGNGWGNGFAGFIDGNNCSIRNINNQYPLIGGMYSGWVKNLSLYGKVESTRNYISALVSYAHNTTLHNITNYANITGTNGVGGVASVMEQNGRTSDGLVNYGKITATGWLNGGVVGKLGGNLNDSTNWGIVIANGDTNTGGVAGGGQDAATWKGIVTNCNNYGTLYKVKAQIVGNLSNQLTLVNCKELGEILNIAPAAN